MVFKQSLKRLLTSNFVIAAILPIVVLGIVSLNILNKSIKEEVFSKNLLLARAVSGEVERFLTEPERILVQIRDMIETEKLISVDNVNSYLASVLRHYLTFEMIRVLDSRGQVSHIAPFEQELVGIDMTGHPFYRAVKQTGRPFWSRTFISIYSGYPTLALALPFRNGVLVGYLNLKALSSITDRITIGNHGYASIVDKNGTYIAHPVRERVVQQVNVKHLRVIKEGLAGFNGSMEFSHKGEPQIGSVIRMTDTGWVVAVFQYSKEAFAPLRKIWGVIGVGAVLATALAVFLAVFNIRKALKPLSLFTEKTKRVAQGDYNYGFEDEAYLEVQAVSENFKQMIQAVRSREEALINARNYTRTVFNSLSSFLVSVDALGNIMEWNAVPGDMGDIVPVEGKRIDRCMSRFFPGNFDIESVIQAGGGRHFERIKVVSGDEIRFFEMEIVPFAGTGIKGAVVRIDHVTEKVRMHEIMTQTEKMMSVGGLAAGMAHEINNPLAGIIQSMQVIRNRIVRSMPKNEEAAEKCGITMDQVRLYMEMRNIPFMLKSVGEAGQRAARIVANMLSFCRKSESKTELHDMKQLVETCVELAGSDYRLSEKYDFRKITIVREYEEDIPQVPCDGIKMQQVFLNLITNAAHAMALQTDPSRTGTLTLCIKNTGSHVVIQVADNGPGMDEAVRKRVFEPFFTTKGTKTGTGLGLSVAYFIVTDDHNGLMTVESTPGRGSRFIVSLPLAD
ncbi:MAG: hypothetical protein GY737_26935 [Desulfobacteraceae bacterium]|nr:hypothetical protein [Desulfobacteraceae bacterium]